MRLVAANTRGVSVEPGRLVAHVLASAVAGVVHDAATRGTLHSSSLKRELLQLVDSYLSAK